MIKAILISLILASTLTAQALPLIQGILPNGTITRCQETEDAGVRAFKLTIKEATFNYLVLQVETLVCLRLEGKMTLVPYALSEKQTYKNNGHVITYEYSEPNLAITKAESANLLERIFIDGTKFNQDVTLNAQTLQSLIIDVGLQMQEIITIDGKVVNKGMIVNGSYRINLEN
ncbi:hypothetical protein CIK05_15360 [Bdellovibrio sp. qaytius]|nr:hypothetical protein CIK05_15360 [Bdellovibrio sp. qaytius]